MHKITCHITLALLMCCTIFSSCFKEEEIEVIPRGRLAEIYAEMLVTDQWITSTPGMRMIADTSLVYEPILQKYGYDLDDYLASVDRYMDDPERFSRILRKSGEIIGRQLKDAERRLAEYKRLEALPRITSDLSFKEFFPYLFDEPYVHYHDSITFEPDSMLIYRLVSVAVSDTLYDGVRMILKTDTLASDDTLAASVEKLQSELKPVVSDDALKIIKDTPQKRTVRPLTNIKKWESKE